MSNENDDATQLGSIGRHMSKPQQPGNPQARPAFQAPSLPTHPQEQDGDEEGTVLSTHNATHYAANTFDADEEGTVLSTHNATPSRPTRPTSTRRRAGSASNGPIRSSTPTASISRWARRWVISAGRCAKRKRRRKNADASYFSYLRGA
jgi:hypothetical protein